MPMTALERDVLAKAFAVCKDVLATLLPKLDSLNELYNSAGGVKMTLTQAELDELPELSGLLKTTVDDAIFALTGMKTTADAAAAALNQMAARFL
jgi:hypothetical protein